MSIGAKSIIVGSACAGAALGYKLSEPGFGFCSRSSGSACVATCTSIGAVGGALYGGVLALAQKVGPVAMEAVLGGTAGLAVGFLPCQLITAFATEAPGTSATAALCFFGACNLFCASAGAIVGAATAKINSIFQRNAENALNQRIRVEVQRELDQRAV